MISVSRASSGPAAVASPQAPPQVESETRTRRMPQYKVLVHNDDVTPMDFVVAILRRIFHKSETEALQIMLEAHQGGLSVAEIAPFEHAELHVDQTHGLARTRHYPLTLTIEPA